MRGGRKRTEVWRMCCWECGRQLIIKERKTEWPSVLLGLECEFLLEPVVANFYSQVQPALESARWVLKDKG